MNIETNAKVNYVGFAKRTVAEVFDFLISFHYYIFVGILVYITLGDNNSSQIIEQAEALIEQIEAIVPPAVDIAITALILIAFKVFMITRLGGTPGKLLCGIRIKDASTLTNVSLMQATIRCIFKESIWITFHLLAVGYNFLYLLIVLVLILFAVFDQRKQAVYDKIANTVVIYYKPTTISEEQ